MACLALFAASCGNVHTGPEGSGQGRSAGGQGTLEMVRAGSIGQLVFSTTSTHWLSKNSVLCTLIAFISHTNVIMVCLYSIVHSTHYYSLNHVETFTNFHRDGRMIIDASLL